MGKSHYIGIRQRNSNYNTKRKRNSHSIIRTHNRNCDDESIQTLNCKMKSSIFFEKPFFYNSIFPIPNCREYFFYDDETLNGYFYYVWNKKDTCLQDTLTTIYNQLPIEPNTSFSFRYYSKQETTFMSALLKQIKRRNKPGRFYGHRCYHI